jgi:hypothetical protein
MLITAEQQPKPLNFQKPVPSAAFEQQPAIAKTGSAELSPPRQGNPAADECIKAPKVDPAQHQG